jgi:ABC-2 type transport system permease protein
MAVERGSQAAIPASTQLLAVAWLRWRLFANGFRRKQSGQGRAGRIIFAILIRLITWPFVALLVVVPALSCGVLAWTLVARHQSQNLVGLLAGVFLLWQFLSLNGISISANLPAFDPATLLRFPLRFGRYLLLRTLLGLMTPMTIVGTLALLSAALGIGIANHLLAFPALLVLMLYASMNVFFTRMMAAWLERWLAHRRAREAFAAIMVLVFVGVQFLNTRATYLSAQGRSRFFDFVSGSAHVLQWLPPGFATNAILSRHNPLAQYTALLACTALFFSIFALRLHKQFLGEYLSDGPARSKAPVSPSPRLPAMTSTWPPFVSPVIAACLRKEWFYLFSGANQLIGLLTPLLFIFVFSRGIFGNHPHYFLPAAIAYALIGLLPGLYNIFGADGTGVQIYLLAPVRLRDIVIAKNMASLALITVQASLAWILALSFSKNPISPETQLSAALWTIFVIAINLTVGTLRSIQAPRKFVPGQARQARTPTGRTSGLLVLALFFGSMLLQIPVILLSRSLSQPWLGAIIFGPLALASIAAYFLLLSAVESLILNHRDSMAEELCRA